MERKQDILDFIERYTTEHGYPPSMRDIAAALEMNRSVVDEYVAQLVDEGRLMQGERRLARTLVVVRNQKSRPVN